MNEQFYELRRRLKELNEIASMFADVHSLIIQTAIDFMDLHPDDSAVLTNALALLESISQQTSNQRIVEALCTFSAKFADVIV